MQFHSGDDDRVNLKRMVAFVKAERGRSDLVVFPELEIRRVFSSSEEKMLLKSLGVLAKSNGTDLVPGSVTIKSGRKTYNRGYYIDRRGAVLAKYDKSSPWKSEMVTPGGGPKAFRTRFGRTALVICWDLASVSIAARLAELDLDLLICPSMWWEGKESGFTNGFARDFVDSLCVTRAYEGRTAVAYVNAAGMLNTSEIRDRSVGRTQFVLPFGGRSAIKGHREGVVRVLLEKKKTDLAKRYFGSV